MQVIRKGGVTRLKEIGRGEIFEFQSRIGMRVKGGNFNVVDMESGELLNLPDSEEVEVLRGVLTVG